jgi:fermentation-respiration switch protein FrsA (DUF1100 family)
MQTRTYTAVVALALPGLCLDACARPSTTSTRNGTGQETNMALNRDNNTETRTATDGDRAAIEETIQNIARGADSEQWETVRSSFAASVVLDYGTPELLSPDEIVGRWRPLLSAFDSTQHLVDRPSVEFVEPTRARAHAPFQATHHLSGASGGDLWILSGRYEYELISDTTGWKVSRLRMLPEASSGNDGLLAVARERARLPPPSPATVTVEHVSFEVDGERIAGILHGPADRRADAGERLAAVAAFGTWTSTKEMIVPNYANILARAGFIVLTIDFRGFGESEGTERRTESPARKIRDIRATVDFLSNHPGIDPDRVGILGICAGAGYVVHEVADDARVRSVALVAPWLHDAAIVDAIYGGAAAVAEKKARGAAARRRFQQTGTIEYVPAASNGDPAAAMYAPGDALDYYLDSQRGGIPQWGNQFALMAWPEWLAFDGIGPAPRVQQPVLVVHSETAAIPRGAHAFVDALPRPPRQVWLNGPTQFDFYDNPSVYSRAAAEAVQHFQATLATRAKKPS